MSLLRSIKLVLLVSFASVMAAPASAQQKKPNVVFILADNVGYGDLGPYGGGEARGAATPRIDELAKEGLRLTQFLVEPACTPSRAALMTAQYSIRNGLSLVLVPARTPRSRCTPIRWGTCSTGSATPRRFMASGISAVSRRACRPRTVLTSSTASRPTYPGIRRPMSTPLRPQLFDEVCAAVRQEFAKNRPVAAGFVFAVAADR